MYRKSFCSTTGGVGITGLDVCIKNPVEMYRKSHHITIGVGGISIVVVGVGINKMLNFYIKVCVMEKVMSGELSCI